MLSIKRSAAAFLADGRLPILEDPLGSVSENQYSSIIRARHSSPVSEGYNRCVIGLLIALSTEDTLKTLGLYPGEHFPVFAISSTSKG